MGQREVMGNSWRTRLAAAKIGRGPSRLASGDQGGALDVLSR
jgi:hypothetical protein